jgi:hypothetical protein
MEQAQVNGRTTGSEDHYLDLKSLAIYSSLAVPTLRGYLREGTLPHYKLKGKIIVRRSDFDGWIERYKVDRRDDLDALVEDALSALTH